jgi:hypothetical protein
MSMPANAASRSCRTTGGIDLGRDASKEAKRLAATILEVLAGLRTPTQAAEALELSLPRYYQLEARGLRGLLEACEAKPRGRQVSAARELATLQQHNARLQRDLTRQQSLVRLAQRAVGLHPPPAPQATGPKGRKRRPVARALSVAARLRQEANATAEPSDNGMSAAVP